jgi:5-methylcytosine-specific restriction endonuclease McrA
MGKAWLPEGVEARMIGKRHYTGVPKKVREAVWERCSGICEGPVERIDGEIVILHTCTKPATELAHLHHRKMGGSRLLDIDTNLVYTCKACHDIFDRRTYAEE